MIDYTIVICAENDNELLWSIKPGAVYDKNWKGHDRSIMSMMKIRQDNDVTDRIGAVYIENETELS